MPILKNVGRAFWFRTVDAAGKGVNGTPTIKVSVGGAVATTVSASAIVAVPSLGDGCGLVTLTDAQVDGDFAFVVSGVTGAVDIFQAGYPEGDYTAVRAGYLDALNGIVAAVWGFAGRTLAVFGDSTGVTTLLGRLTLLRANNLDLVDRPLSTLSTYAGGDTSGTTTLLSRLTAGRAANLDNLDATISGVSAKLDTLLVRIASTLTITAGKVDVNDRTGFSLTGAERSAIAAATEAALLNEGDGQAILQAIVDKINATDPNLGGLTISAIAQGVWQYLTSGATLAGSIGKLVADNLDAKVSLRATQASVNAIPTNPALASDVSAARDAVNAHTDAQVAPVTAAIGLVKAKTDLVQLDGGGYVKAVAQNLPADYQQRGVAATLPAAAPTAWRVALAALQPDYAPAKPSDVSPTIAFSPTLNPTLTDAQAATVARLGGMVEADGPQFRFTAEALEQAPSGGGGAGSYTDADRLRDAQTAAGVGALGSLPITLPTLNGAGGEISARKGTARTILRGDPLARFEIRQDLTGAVMELHDASDGIVSTALPEPPSTPGGPWLVRFESGASAFTHRGRRAYWVGARWVADGAEFALHERLSGTILVS